MGNEKVCTLSGKDLEDLTMESLLSGDLTAEDFRISIDTLRCQADNADAAGYPHLAANLRRAAELTRISNEEVFEIYNTLRPGRATYKQIMRAADRLEKEFDAPLTAAFVREAAEVYRERGILK
jgi:propanediol dehydratase small subunit